jgi:acetolactate synthase-1/2/3 large subunit
MLKTFYSFGQGVILGQEEEFKAFVEKSGIPAAWTILVFPHYQQSIL